MFISSTQDIDKRLGTFQKLFSLKGDEVRHVAARAPKLITFSVQSVKSNMFALKEEMGFTDDELKTLLLEKPIIYVKSKGARDEPFVTIQNVFFPA